MEKKSKLSIKMIVFLTIVFIAGSYFLFFYHGQTGKILVATSRIDSDPHFSKKVVYIYNNSINGALGIVINDKINIGDIKNETIGIDSGAENIQLYKGGPLEFPYVMSVALENSKIDKSSFGYQPLSIVKYSDFLEKGLHKRKQLFTIDNPMNIYFGYSSWSPGQLENEIYHGVWKVIDCDIKTVKDIPTSNLWEHLTSHNEKDICQ